MKIDVSRTPRRAKICKILYHFLPIELIDLLLDFVGIWHLRVDDDRAYLSPNQISMNLITRRWLPRIIRSLESIDSALLINFPGQVEVRDESCSACRMFPIGELRFLDRDGTSAAWGGLCQAHMKVIRPNWEELVITGVFQSSGSRIEYLIKG